ncbi:hypothetical protein B4U80_12078 [Leptotrombidium deliense]|uniref:Tc1-like transposase DDE domain-containing protein n=1 Tax=Leptotrombidium deliense TaxID=299467 RepID=A0A443RYN3_9ACAR|nr:hypothetical protein B4U80_12078 [Leptotrombidium deliense]
MNSGEINETPRIRRPHLTLDEKCKIVSMHSAGRKVSEIAAELQRGKQTIRDILNRWSNEESILRKAGTGKKRKTSEEEDTQLTQFAINNPFATNEQIANAANLELSKQSVSRRLKDVKRKRYVAAKKPHLTGDEIEERFDYALNYSNWTNDECNQVVCMDESCVETTPKGSIRVTRLRNTRFDKENIDDSQHAGRLSIPIHAWISYHGLGTMTKIDGHLNSEKYMEILQTEIPKINDRFQHNNWYLVNDRSPIHTANTIKEYIRSLPVHDMNHPRKSPDLNPIENVFGELKRKIKKRIRSEGRIRRKEQLWNWMSDAWKEIAESNFVYHLYRTFPIRFYEVTNKHGHFSRF